MKYRLTRLILLLLFCLFSVSVAQADLAPGTTVPDFELTDMNGKPFKLSAYKGHPFILKLATTWCPSCKQQSVEFSKAQDFLQDNKIPVIEVFVDDSEEDVRAYIKQHPLESPHATMLDDGRVYEAYNIYLIPRVLVVDREFKVKRDGSVIDAGALKPILSQLL